MKPPVHRFQRYFFVGSVAFFLVIIMGYVFIEDVQLALHYVADETLSWILE